MDFEHYWTLIGGDVNFSNRKTAAKDAWEQCSPDKQLSSNIMLLKLIKIREMNSGAHCELWEINSVLGDHLLATIYVLNEHIPLELIYRLTVSWRGICIQGRHCAWQWTNEVEQRMVTHFLEQIQTSHEEIRIEVCRPKPYLPGYPEVDYHPDDFPIVQIDDL